ncbi:16S rRNA (cytosine(1402)-N(4))-methyltransferase, partial [Streptococcus vestibularis]|nr:16S rRNA (cytosine(1402)-N(4))-methyltransferase [Streptococcus vestibularis]
MLTYRTRQFLHSCAIIEVMTNEFHHVTVLLHETVDMLDIK